MPKKTAGRLLAALALTLALLPFLLGGAAPSVANAQAAGTGGAGRVIVKTRSGGLRGALGQAMASQPRPEQYGARDGGERAGSGAHVWQVPAGREEEIARSLARRDDVEYAEPDRLRQAHLVPSDPLYAGAQWNLPRIEAPTAWDGTVGAASVVVAVIDTGFDLSHPDRPSNLLVGCDFVAWRTSAASSCPSVAGDPHGHGTHVAGIVAAAQGNGVGLSGVAPQVSVLVVRALDETGSGYASDTADAIRYAVDAGARVINLSLGSDTASAYEQSAAEYAQGRGVLVVASAGNGYQSGNRTSYPAAYPGVLAVGASTVDDGRAPYSNTGDYVGLVAPGGDGSSADGRAITSLYPVAKGSYAALNGTSMAAPHVAGAAGLLFSLRPDLTGPDAGALLRQTAHPLGGAVPNPEFGYGRLDLAAAVHAAQTFGASGPTPTPTVTPTPTPPADGVPDLRPPPEGTATPPAVRVTFRQVMPLAAN